MAISPLVPFNAEKLLTVVVSLLVSVPMPLFARVTRVSAVTIEPLAADIRPLLASSTTRLAVCTMPSPSSSMLPPPWTVMFPVLLTTLPATTMRLVPYPWSVIGAESLTTSPLVLMPVSKMIAAFRLSVAAPYICKALDRVSMRDPLLTSTPLP